MTCLPTNSKITVVDISADIVEQDVTNKKPTNIVTGYYIQDVMNKSFSIENTKAMKSGELLTTFTAIFHCLFLSWVLDIYRRNTKIEFYFPNAMLHEYKL